MSSTQTEHSPIGASSAYKWFACPGSIRESRGKPNIQSEYAAEGTLAHEVAARKLLGKKIDFEVSEEMEEAVGVYVDFIEERSKKCTQIDIEKRCDLSSIHPGCFGTADSVLWNEEEKLLSVYDFKYGSGIMVEVQDNPQLKYYALGALLEFKYPAKKVEMGIVQPRCAHPDGPIRSVTVDVLDLYDFSIDLVNYAKATEDPNAPLVPGSHCRFCLAAPSCPALFSKTQELAVIEFSAALPYDPEKLKIALDGREAVKAWLKALDEFAYAEAEAGRCPPGYKLVQKRPTRKWKDEKKAEKVFSRAYGTQAYDKKLKSPAQMEKIKNKKNLKKKIDTHSEKISRGNTLVPDSDKRQEVNPSALADFSAEV